ncbi:MAG: toxin-antitoxin system YwqK family antitoxin [Fusobacteriaceae bacterium]
MKKKICLFLICLFFLACGKEEVIDSLQLQERNGIYYKVNEEKGFTGTSIAKYLNGQLAFEETFKNGKLNGIHKQYYENGQLQQEANYKNGQSDGPYKLYYLNGELKENGNYKDGKLDGPNKIYYKDGELEREVNYKNGLPDGPYKSYLVHGPLERELNYKNGQLDGTGRSYYPSGRIKTYYYFDVSETYEDEPLDFKALMELCKEIEELIKNSDGDHVWEFGEYLIPLLEGYSYSNNLTTKEVMELNLLEAETNRISETYFKE